MNDLREYRILNMNAPAAYTEQASNIALACEQFIGKRRLNDYEYVCDSPQLAKIEVFSSSKQKIGLYMVCEAIK